MMQIFNDIIIISFKKVERMGVLPRMGVLSHPTYQCVAHHFPVYTTFGNLLIFDFEVKVDELIKRERAVPVDVAGPHHPIGGLVAETQHVLQHDVRLVQGYGAVTVTVKVPESRLHLSPPAVEMRKAHIFLLACMIGMKVL